MGMADLVFADIPKNQPVPNVSYPAYSVPFWNALNLDFLGELFDFADKIIHDDGAPLFHLDDNGDFKDSIQDHFAAFGLTIFKRIGWESTVFAFIPLNLWTRPLTSSKLCYLVVPQKQSNLTLISGLDTRHFAFAMPMSSRLLVLSSNG